MTGPFLREMGDPATLDRLDKHYLATRASNYDHAVPYSYPKKLPVTLKESPSGEGQKVPIRFGDDLSSQTGLKVAQRVALRLRIMRLTSEDTLEIRLNGKKLDASAARSEFLPAGESAAISQYSFMAEAYYGHGGPYHWIEFELSGGNLPTVGINEIEVILRKRNPVVTEDVVLNDVEVVVEYEKRDGVTFSAGPAFLT